MDVRLELTDVTDVHIKSCLHECMQRGTEAAVRGQKEDLKTYSVTKELGECTDVFIHIREICNAIYIINDQVIRRVKS